MFSGESPNSNPPIRVSFLPETTVTVSPCDNASPLASTPPKRWSHILDDDEEPLFMRGYSCLDRLAGRCLRGNPTSGFLFILSNLGIPWGAVSVEECVSISGTLVQRSTRRNPYGFLYGEENTGSQVLSYSLSLSSLSSFEFLVAAPPPPEITCLSLIPCPTRPLSSSTSVHQPPLR